MFPEYKTKGLKALPQMVLFTSEHVSQSAIRCIGKRTSQQSSKQSDPNGDERVLFAAFATCPIGFVMVAAGRLSRCRSIPMSGQRRARLVHHCCGAIKSDCKTCACAWTEPLLHQRSWGRLWIWHGQREGGAM